MEQFIKIAKKFKRFEAALAGGMDVLGVGDSVVNTNATYKAENLAKFDIELIK